MDKFRTGYRSPPVTKQLRNILDQYPDDGQILKELILNAEDAGATEIKFLLDHTNYDADPKKLINPELVQFQGPALYAYNDAEFSDSDWDSIAMIMSSNKEDDPMKVGRFGMGFKAVYHMTDFPSLMSGDGIGFMDPHERYFKNDSHGNKSCSLWKFSEDSTNMRRLLHQFQPFQRHQSLFGVNKDVFSGRGYTGKTLFRFPLRTADSKRHSELSKNIYTPEKVHQLFGDLKGNGANLLLFLMHLRRIEVYELKSQHKSLPQKIIDISIAKSCQERVTCERLRFENIIKTEENVDKPFCVSFPVKIETILEAKDKQKLTEEFVVSLYHNACIMSEKVKEVQKFLKVLPCAGAAVSVDSRHGNGTESESGQIFCFLPLPLAAQNSSGLKLHVHGYFVLDQNRRNLKWPDANRSRDLISDRHHIWNIFVMKELVPRALVHLAVFVSELGGVQDCLKSSTAQIDILEKVMPNDDEINPDWRPMVVTFYQTIVKHKVFYSKAKNGIWLNICDANTIVDNLDDDTELADILRKILTECDRHLVSVPRFVITGIQKHNSSCVLRKIQPDDICHCLRTRSVRLNDQEKLSLLDYLLKNLDRQNKLQQLVGLPLLPLDYNQQWKNFEQASATKEKIYVEDGEHQQMLLPGLERFFLRSCFKQNKVLLKIAKSGKTQLEILNKASVLRLLCHVIGLRNSSCGAITIQNGNRGCLNLNWFQLLWNYIEKHCIMDLSTLADSKLYIIPFKQATELALLCEDLPLIEWDNKQDERLKEALINLNVFLLDDLPHFVSHVAEIWDKYILRPNLTGVLEALKRIRTTDGKEKLIEKFRRLQSQSKIAFYTFITSRYDLEVKKGICCEAKKILQMLPYFKLLDKSGFKEEHFVSLEDVPNAVTSAFSLPFEVPAQFIKLDKSVSDTFQKHLDIQVYSEAHVLCEFVFPNVNNNSLDNQLAEKAMKYCLDNIDNLESAHSGFKKAMSQVKFLSANDQKGFRTPGQLFDDSVDHIKDLFYDCDVFPVGEFSKTSYRAKLRMIGLKGLDQITVNDFLMAAYRINGKVISKEVIKKARALQILLNETLKSKIFTPGAVDELKRTLSSRMWILPSRERPKDYPEGLAFVGENSSLLSPNELCSDEYCYVVGSVKATANLGELDALVKCFELGKEPGVKDVVRHLDNIIHLPEFKGSTLGKRKLSEETPVASFIKGVKSVCEKVYEYLNERVEQNKSYMETLSEKNFVFINGHFMKASLCALQSQLCYPPFLSRLPYDLALSYKNLWNAMRVRKQFDVKSYVQFIEDIYSDIGQEPLSKEQLNMVLKIIGECTSDESELQPGIKIYLPDHRKVLRLASELHFNDTHWLPADPSDKTPLCHPCIAPSDAKKFGVASWRQNAIRLHKQRLPGQKFGQRVNLVSRLKRILEGYPLDEGILKELVQNADDAGATKIHFIKDLRNLPNEKIFDDKWKPMQQCSLCVYNDKPFTQKDLEGIQCLGEGSKSKERMKIGKYGIGFSCVYNLTDVPTFLTEVDGVGRVLCVMDPTLQHVEDASEDSPGFMYDKIRILKKRFPDAFSGYLDEHYGISGTVFRFPLRRKESPISGNIVTEKSLCDLFDAMKEEMESCLIFLKNIKEIALREICPNGKIQNLFCATATVKSADQKKLDEFHRSCKDACVNLDAGRSLDSIKAEEVAYVMETSDSRNVKQDWLIVQQLGFADSSFVNENRKTYHDALELNLLPLAGVAYPISRKIERGEMKLYCCLPLPKATNLPVHVNGHFSLDSENRRALWENNKADFRSEWNKRVMSDVAARAYCMLIAEVKNFVTQKASSLKRNLKGLTEDILEKFHYQSVFPRCSTGNDKFIHQLNVSVYKILWNCNSAILPVYSIVARDSKVNIEWMGPQGSDERKPCFDHLKTEVEKIHKVVHCSDKDEHERNEELLRDVLISYGFPLVHKSCNLYYHFLQSGLSVQYSSPDCICHFFANTKTCQLPCDLKKTSFKTVHVFKTVLQICSNAKNFKGLVRQTPFLLTQDEILRQFGTTSVPFYSDDYGVAVHTLQKFAHVEIRDILKNAGMTCELTVTDFISLLPHLLPLHVFQGVDKTVTFETFCQCLQNQSLIQCREKFLQRIWKFIFFTMKPSDYEHLKEWCLLPVILNEEELLLPVSKANSVIIGSEVKETFDANLLEALTEVGMPVLNETYISPSTMALFPNCKVHLSVTIIQHLTGLKTHDLVIRKQRICLLEFLSCHLQHWLHVKGVKEVVKCLPIFEYFDGTIGNLVKSECYIVPEILPKQEAIKWTAENDAVFLRSSYSIHRLLDFLECKHIMEDRLYSRFIFRNFHRLSPEGRVEHLKFVRDIVIERTKDTDGTELHKSLKSLRFLSSSDSSELLTASAFYNWNIEIFQVMQQPSDFPPQPFKNDEWLTFLKLCGLISDVTEDHLLRYANEVTKQTRRRVDDEPVRKKARVLVKNIMELNDLSENFADAVKLMPIVPAVVVPKNLSLLHPQKVGKYGSFIGYKSSLEQKHTEIVWTTSELLPGWATRKRKLLHRLEVRDKPPGTTVAQHLLNICNSFLAKLPGTEGKEEFYKIAKSIYKFLSSEEISKTDVDCLTNSRCIIVCAENELVTADQVVINMHVENEIRPYLYRLPKELYEYVNFFQKIGVTEDLQVEHYARVLSKVFQKVGNAELIPNDRRVTLKAFVRLLNMLHVKETVDLKELILPSENGKLHSSSDLVIKDDIDLANRVGNLKGLNFLIDFNELKDHGLNNTDYRIFDKLPQNIRPSLLSVTVSQKLEKVSECSEKSCTRSSKIMKTITSPQFAEGIMCLITSKADVNSDTVIRDKIKNLSKLQIFDVPSVTTYLEYKQKRIPNSEKELSFFVSNVSADVIKVFISERLYDTRNSHMLSARLACLVNELLDGALQPVLVNVSPLFHCNPDEIASTLGQLGFQGCNSSKNEERMYLPKLGSFVPIAMHHMLQQGLCSFKKGDLVALEYGDPDDSVYILVEIIEQISIDGDSSHNARYRVKTGDDTEQTVSGSDLYQFCSPLSLDEEGVLVLVEAVNEHGPVDHKIPKFKDIIRDIRKTLIESKTLPEDQRKRIIKRLYLRWHPDKNPPEMTVLCTKIVQELQKLVANIDNLSPEDDDRDRDNPDGQFSNSEQFYYRASWFHSRGSSHYSSTSSGTFSFNFNFWDETARRHKKQNETFRDQNTRSGHSAYQGNYFSFKEAFERQPNPQPQEAKRWMRQAEYDLESAGHDTLKKYFEWSCYKYHQAAEKALKAIQYKRNANQVQQFTHNLLSLCSGLTNPSVAEWVKELVQIIPNPAAMRYPNNQNYPKVPHDVYSGETTAKVKLLARNIVNFTKSFIEK